MNLVKAKYGSEPGLTAYTHLSDQYAPFATQRIPATVGEAPYILDGLLMNETGQRIREQYGYRRLHRCLCCGFNPETPIHPSHPRSAIQTLLCIQSSSTPQEPRGIVGGKIREDTILQNGPVILRSAGAPGCRPDRTHALHYRVDPRYLHATARPYWPQHTMPSRMPAHWAPA